jgi:hypothetical protein
MEAVCTSEMSVDNYFTRQYIPEDNSEHSITLYWLPGYTVSNTNDSISNMNCEI